jgi:peptide methionine sulfoxide reductase msrA/msrB
MGVPMLVWAVVACDGTVACDDATAQTPARARVGGLEARGTMPRYSRSGFDITTLPPERVAALASRLDPEAFRITQRAGTEAPFCGGLLANHEDGVYTCVVCGLPVFRSEAKFDSGTGWPSFDRPFDADHVARHDDGTHGMVRTEIACARCGAHLGHVFDDGPTSTGERHCLNSASLEFHREGRLPAASLPVQTETAYFAGGCFWGLEHYFQRGAGVLDAVSGYMQGEVEQPTYEQVCSDATGHAETVKVVFDPARTSYRDLLEAFFRMHDPTQVDRQGPDVGTQYRSGIWTTSDTQHLAATDFVRSLATDPRLGGRPVATQIQPARAFWPAEDYHQDYIERTGRACHVPNPWPPL